jgi:hypothetical protein
VLVSATRELLVLVSATRELLVLMWVRVLATRVWLVPPSVLVSATRELLVLVSATRELLVLMWVQVLATLVWVVPLSVPATLLWWDHHNTHPRTHRSCCMQYLLEERPCHQGIVQPPSLC